MALSRRERPASTASRKLNPQAQSRRRWIASAHHWSSNRHISRTTSPAHRVPRLLRRRRQSVARRIGRSHGIRSGRPVTRRLAAINRAIRRIGPTEKAVNPTWWFSAAGQPGSSLPSPQRPEGTASPWPSWPPACRARPRYAGHYRHAH